jgi:hypothetical protein
VTSPHSSWKPSIKGPGQLGQLGKRIGTNSNSVSQKNSPTSSALNCLVVFSVFTRSLLMILSKLVITLLSATVTFSARSRRKQSNSDDGFISPDGNLTTDGVLNYYTYTDDETFTMVWRPTYFINMLNFKHRLAMSTFTLMGRLFRRHPLNGGTSSRSR